MPRHRASTILVLALLLLTLAACGENAAGPSIATPPAAATATENPNTSELPSPTAAAGATLPQGEGAEPTRTRRPLPATATPLVLQAEDVQDTPSGSAIDVCALLREAGAVELLGEPTEEPAEIPPGGGAVQGSCKWSVADPEGGFLPPQVLVQIISFSGTPEQLAEVLAANLEDPSKLEVVDGLGDYAAWAPTVGGGWLAALKGDLYLSIIAIKLPREKVEPLARGVVDRMP